jgi:hypothetical protein
MGRPASIFVMIKVIKYPTTFGRLLPNIARMLLGCSTISPRESRIEPAVTVIKILAS